MFGVTPDNTRQSAACGADVPASQQPPHRCGFPSQIAYGPGQRRIAAQSILRAPEGIPLGRHATPEDVAPAVVFLASREAGWINGSTVTTDGGISGALATGLVPDPDA